MKRSVIGALLVAGMIVVTPASASADPTWGSPDCSVVPRLCLDAYRPGYIGQIHVRVYRANTGGDVWYLVNGSTTWHWALGKYADASGYFAGSFTVPQCAYSKVWVKATDWAGVHSDADFVYSIC
ncbi:hypothetical protein [Nonomuraea endophytica]|uniref:hypothetical protein n=1 Tax=Nonomuraea endophytica TaxID=714136 RepID=UPI0037C6DA5C